MKKVLRTTVLASTIMGSWHSFEVTDAGKLCSMREKHSICDILYSQCSTAADYEDQVSSSGRLHGRILQTATRRGSVGQKGI